MGEDRDRFPVSIAARFKHDTPHAEFAIGFIIISAYAPFMASPNTLRLGPAQSDWSLFGLVDDVRPALADMLRSGQRGALATLVGVDGPSPRPLGSQMLIDSHGHAVGYVSGGCVEGSIAILGQEVIASGIAQRVIFGSDSPFKDIVLICGTRIEVLVEPVFPDDTNFLELVVAYRSRQTYTRRTAPDAQGRTFECYHEPATRLIILGHDPVALASVHLGRIMGLDTVLVRDKGPSQAPDGFADTYLNASATHAFETLLLDAWTAVVTTTHDLDQDHLALTHALQSPCFYVGALGSKRRLDDRQAKLRAAGLSKGQIATLRAPVGLSIGAASPYEIAVSILGDIVAARRLGKR